MSMFMKKFIIISLVIIGVIFTIAFAASFEDRPNIILILTDDLSVGMLQFLLENNLMPNLQHKIIDHGTEFTNSFVTDPLCCPSRATTLTGLFPHNHGVFFNEPKFILGKIDGGVDAFDDSSTIATWLKKTGYTTGYVGKYLNGYNWKDVKDPVPGWDYWYVTMGSGTYRMNNYNVNDNSIVRQNITEYQTIHLADKTVNFIESSKNPFFLLVSTLAPHGSFDAISCEYSEGNNIYSVSVEQKYKGSIVSKMPKPPSFNKKITNELLIFSPTRTLIENEDCIETVFIDRAESMRSVDDLIGKVFSTLEGLRILDNTIVIFTSDNGFMFGEHGFVGKNRPYEESIRVPLYIRVPSISSQIVSHLVINNDLAPTIAEFGGIESDVSHDGLSLVSILKNSSKKFREAFLVEGYLGKNAFHAIRGDGFLYVEYNEDPNLAEYYDLHEDPYQENIIKCTNEKCVTMIMDLSHALSSLKQCKGKSCQEFLLMN